MTTTAGVGDAVAALRCRDELLQAMYWLRGEDPGEGADIDTLDRLLLTDGALVREQLAVLVADGLITRDAGRYRLTDAGIDEGGRRFADEFADLTRSAHGDCPPNCRHCADLPRDACDHCLGADPDGAAWRGA